MKHYKYFSWYSKAHALYFIFFIFAFLYYDFPVWFFFDFMILLLFCLWLCSSFFKDMVIRKIMPACLNFYFAFVCAWFFLFANNVATSFFLTYSFSCLCKACLAFCDFYLNTIFFLWLILTYVNKKFCSLILFFIDLVIVCLIRCWFMSCYLFFYHLANL